MINFLGFILGFSTCHWYATSLPFSIDRLPTVFTGYMFGKGVYFADVRFSFNYEYRQLNGTSTLCRWCLKSVTYFWTELFAYSLSNSVRWLLPRSVSNLERFRATSIHKIMTAWATTLVCFYSAKSLRSRFTSRWMPITALTNTARPIVNCPLSSFLTTFPHLKPSIADPRKELDTRSLSNGRMLEWRWITLLLLVVICQMDPETAFRTLVYVSNTTRCGVFCGFFDLVADFLSII